MNLTLSDILLIHTGSEDPPLRLSEPGEGGIPQAGYQMVICLSGEEQFVHRIVGDYIDRPPGSQVIHHIDFNKLNNEPWNLKWMTWGAHRKLHSDHIQKLNADPEFQRRRAERTSKQNAEGKAGFGMLHKDPEFSRRNSERRIRMNADPEFQEMMRKLNAEGTSGWKLLHKDPEFEKKRLEALSKKNTAGKAGFKMLWEDKKFRRTRSESIIRRNADPVFQARRHRGILLYLERRKLQKQIPNLTKELHLQYRQEFLDACGVVPDYRIAR